MAWGDSNIQYYQSRGLSPSSRDQYLISLQYFTISRQRKRKISVFFYSSNDKTCQCITIFTGIWKFKLLSKWESTLYQSPLLNRFRNAWRRTLKYCETVKFFFLFLFFLSLTSRHNRFSAALTFCSWIFSTSWDDLVK
jgi:hypothetical protein